MEKEGFLRGTLFNFARNGMDKRIIFIAVIIVVVIVATGYLIMSKIIKRKWGYTPEREKELEELKDNGIYKYNKKRKW